MRVRQGELQSLAKAIVTSLTEKGFMKPKADPMRLQERIVALIAKTFEQEAALELEAERMAVRLGSQARSMDQTKLIQGIMARLAKERDFPL